MAINIDPNILKKDALAEKLLTHETELERARSDRGWLGKFWGSKENTPNNIAALIAFLAFILGLLYTLCTMNTPSNQLSISIKDFWAIMVPIITLTIGYLFGDKGKK
jgi:hypothetical protein